MVKNLLRERLIDTFGTRFSCALYAAVLG
jgi:hypothetical protein